MNPNCVWMGFLNAMGFSLTESWSQQEFYYWLTMGTWLKSRLSLFANPSFTERYCSFPPELSRGTFQIISKENLHLTSAKGGKMLKTSYKPWHVQSEEEASLHKGWKDTLGEGIVHKDSDKERGKEGKREQASFGNRRPNKLWSYMSSSSHRSCCSQ